MSDGTLIDAIDISLLTTAARYRLGEPGERNASARWLIDLFAILLSGPLKCDVFWEIGAYSAEFSRRVRPALPAAKMIAFEANPHNFELFRSTVVDAGIDYINCAVGSGSGVGEFFVQKTVHGSPVDRVSGNNSLKRRAVMDIEYDALQVNLVSIDDFARDPSLEGYAGGRHSMWIDVEGAAYDVLSGCERTLKNTDMVFVEVEEKIVWDDQKVAHAVKQLMLKSSFVPIARDFEYEGQYNIIFMKDAVFRRYDVRRAIENWYGINYSAYGSK